jgi:adenine-specific DNA-methyltransferase
MSEKLDRFVDLLRKIFELDKSDLDFGIYRIMNICKGQIDEFLSQTLPEQVREVIKPVGDNTTEIRIRMREIEKEAQKFKAEAVQNEEYRELKERSEVSIDFPSLESDVYSHLYNFFNRYYDEGDFISKRRYKEGVYAIPYEGEEVKLYWANQDQYYIKTTENFKDYSFVSDGVTVHFMLVDATTEQNNNKENGKKRAFMLFTENEEQPGIKTFEKKNNEFIIHFVYDLSEEKQPAWDEKNYTAIKEYIVRNHDKLIPLITPSIPSTNDQISPIQKHLFSYVAKNTFDYFIHKDLSGFLNRELDFFIKNEIIHLDDINTEKEEHVSNYLTMVRAVKKIGKIIIDFLAQTEDFQKRLWLKKKFVIRTDYCITLDKISEKYYEEIRSNKAQIQEWIDLYAIDEVSGNGGHDTTEKWTNPPSIDFLKANKYLVIDTKHFNTLFKEAVLSNIDNLDEVTDGVLVQSDNFHALNLLQERYKEKIQSIYIDPPYNADSSEILYKNGFKHSSWLSLMQSGLLQAKYLMTNVGMICFTIDDYERENAMYLLQQVFNDNIKGIVAIRNNPQGRSTVKGFAINHEYALFCSKSDETISVGRLDHSQKQKDRYSETDENGNKYLWENFRKTGTDSNRADRPKQFYPIYVNQKDYSFRIPKLTWNKNENKWDIHGNPTKDEIELLPISDTGEEKVWKWGIERIENSPNDIKIQLNGDGIQIYRRNYYNEEGALPNTWWDKAQYAAGSHGTNLLTDIFGKNRMFLFPKSVFAVMDCITVCGTSKTDLVIDYFAGSATTGHAVINLNRSDEGNRKYILVEMGDYFNSVTKPRMQKVIYADDWKDGKPLSRNTGVSHIMKYFCLESYDDTLTNIEFSDNQQSKNLEYGDEYLINYMLNVETKGSLLNISRFKEPFDYRLKITEKNEVKETSVDLVETFNYLLGLNVVRNGALRFYKAVKNNDNDYEGSVDLKEDKDGDFMFKQIKGHLNDENRILIIWRNITDNLLESNNALDAYFQKNRPNFANRDFDIVYVNGDNNLENLRLDNERWKVKIIEKEFMDRMFED